MPDKETLRVDLENTAAWRREKAAEHPNDQRNTEAAALLDELAASVDAVDNNLIDAYSALFDDLEDTEQHCEMLRRIGFSYWPSSAEEFVREYIANRAVGDAVI